MQDVDARKVFPEEKKRILVNGTGSFAKRVYIKRGSWHLSYLGSVMGQ
jgi:hypothetical protein